MLTRKKSTTNMDIDRVNVALLIAITQPTTLIVEKSHYVSLIELLLFEACVYRCSFAHSCAAELKPLIKSYWDAYHNVNPSNSIRNRSSSISNLIPIIRYPP